MAMFAHLMNRRESLARVRTWLEPDGRLFMYILLISTRIATRSRSGAALALVPFRRIRPVRVCRRPRMWRQPFRDDGGIIFRCVSLIAAAKGWLWNFWSGESSGPLCVVFLHVLMEPAHNLVSRLKCLQNHCVNVV